MLKAKFGIVRHDYDDPVVQKQARVKLKPMKRKMNLDTDAGVLGQEKV